VTLRDRLKRAQRAVEAPLDTFQCSGCGETFQVAASAWMGLLIHEWAEEARECGSISSAELARAEALRGPGVEELERHAAHGEIFEPGGQRVWPPAWGAV
jgi:hypothetical protein